MKSRVLWIADSQYLVLFSAGNPKLSHKIFNKFRATFLFLVYFYTFKFCHKKNCLYKRQLVICETGLFFNNLLSNRFTVYSSGNNVHSFWKGRNIYSAIFRS